MAETEGIEIFGRPRVARTSRYEAVLGGESGGVDSKCCDPEDEVLGLWAQAPCLGVGASGPSVAGSLRLGLRRKDGDGERDTPVESGVWSIAFPSSKSNRRDLGACATSGRAGDGARCVVL